MTAAFNVDYDLSSGDNLIYERPKENEHNQSYIKNTTLFQGRELDYETGLYYFRNRHFNPELGRFMQADPLGYHDSMNLYQAMGNNPVNFTDPMGTVVKPGIDPLYVSDMYNIIRGTGRSHKKAYRALLQSGYVTDTGRKEDELYQMGLAAQPSLDVFDVIPVQFAKDVAGGVINFGVGIVGMVAQGLSQGNPVSTYQISRAQNAVSSKINSAIGANENSLGYWMGGTYSAAIAGGIFAAELESVTAYDQTKQTLPFLGTEPIIQTPYGNVFQSQKEAALLAREDVKNGALMYRLGKMGKSEASEAQFWALEHPSSYGYASRYGIPSGNIIKADFIEAAVLNPGSKFVTRPAPGIGANIGGGIEVVVERNGVIMKFFCMIKKGVRGVR